MDPRQGAAGNIQSLHGRAGSNDELFKSDLAARLQAEDVLRDVYATDFGTQFEFDSMFAIERLRADSDLLFLVFACQEALGKGRPLVGERVLGRNDRSSPGFSPRSTISFAA